jgi:pimeloyl-ACP methyl ester carboxylesterase
MQSNIQPADKNLSQSDKTKLSRRGFLTGVVGAAATATGILKAPNAHASAPAPSQGSIEQAPIALAHVGSFFAAGRTVTAAGTWDPTKNILLFPNDGDTFWVDQLYVQYQIPVLARSLPIVMVHGGGQTGKTWETTPDGREGFQTTFVRRRFPVYVVDFPSRGKAGFPSFTGTLGNLTGTQIIPDQTARYGSNLAFTLFRLGETPYTFFANSQFPTSGLQQFFQQSVPFFFSADDPDMISNAIAALFDQIGPAILLTHSQSGQFGWLTAIKSSNVKAIIAYEPGTFYFPTGSVPTPPSFFDGTTLPLGLPVALADFQKLTKIPIQIVYGDNIPTSPIPNYGLDLWRVTSAYAPLFVSAINEQGGNASILSLPRAGLYGNTHFSFSDLNSLAVADLLSEFLNSQGLDI